MPRKKGGSLKIKRSKKQKAWEYMKRNRVFRVGDLCMCIDATVSTLHSFFWTLEKVGYLRLVVQSPRERSNRIYAVVKHTGLQSPSLRRSGMYDHNTGKSFYVLPSTQKELLYREILNFEQKVFTAKEIRDHLGIKKSKVQPALKNLLNKEVLIIDSVGKKGEYLFRVSENYKNIVGKDLCEKDITVCPVCHSVHTST